MTPLGIPLGFGINVSWANGGSVGVYGEVAYRVGGTASYNYNYSYAQGNLGWNIGIGVAWNPNMPYSAYGQSMGIGLGISYGSGGFNYGFNGYYQGLSL